MTLNYYVPDLSGTDPTYRNDGDTYTLRRAGQKIHFQSPVYKAGLQILITGDPGNPLLEGIDWEVLVDDEDTTTLSKLSNAEPNFDKTILSSITITRTITTPLRVQMVYQQVYPVTFKTSFSGNELVEMSADGWINMQSRLANVEALAARVNDVVADTPRNPVFLEFDLHKENPDNVIHDEDYVVNVFDGKNVILPAQGSFFKDSVVLVIPALTEQDDDTPLDFGTDYIFIYANHAKTAQSRNGPGIYDGIKILRSMAGTVRISEYHAVGGNLTLGDGKTLLERIANLERFILTNTFVTENGLPSSRPMVTLSNRIVNMEDQLRILTSGSPFYGDSTGGNGVAVPKRIRANDAGFHWWTIAKMYKVGTAPDIFLRDRMRLRINLVEAKLQADVAISVDISRPDFRLSVDADGVLQDVNFTLYGIETSPTLTVMPKFRIIWNQDVVASSGVYLQIGLHLPTLTETLVLNDHSGIESTLILDGTTGTVGNRLLPNDDNIILPDGASVWSTVNGTSRVETKMMPNATGYRIWSGSKPFPELDSGNGAWSPTVLVQNFFDIKDVKKLHLEFANASGQTFTCPVVMTGTGVLERRGQGVVSINDMAIVVSAILNKHATTGAVSITINAGTQASEQTTTYALRYVIAHLK